uniref:Uncharacterized protein n=1 Tax=Anopheles dirus TaxID=7168 RepID=A0A182NY30_9DIPT
MFSSQNTGTVCQCIYTGTLIWFVNVSTRIH